MLVSKDIKAAAAQRAREITASTAVSDHTRRKLAVILLTDPVERADLETHLYAGNAPAAQHLVAK